MQDKKFSVVLFRLQPQPWRRARTMGKRFFVDAKTADYKAKLKELYVDGGGQLHHGPLVVRMKFCIGPKGADEKKIPWTWYEAKPHCKRPDIDNLCKSVMDALNGVAWDDDGQIWKLEAEMYKVKGYGCIILTVEENDGQ